MRDSIHGLGGTASHLVSNSIVLPIRGWLQQVLGRKFFFQICAVLFTASSVLCAFSTSLEMIVVARVLQGLGEGAGPGGAFHAGRQLPAGKMRPGRRFASACTIIVAPATGPVLGDWVTDTFS